VSAVTALAAVEAREAAAPRIVVTVGTDHHPFDRLIGWTNEWLRRHPEQIQAVFVQSGAASVVPACPGSRFLDVGHLNTLLDAADVIVCHGGPASISGAWTRGQLPIVVPRMPQLGEHVDDHQVDFCRKVAELGRVRLAQTAADFAGLLDEAAGDHARFRTSLPGADVDAAVARFGEFVEELAGRPRHRLPLIHRGRRIRGRPVAGTGAPAGAGNMTPGLTPVASTTWHATGSSTRAGLAGMANEEQE
jgi:UDP-N-acetylglucosamine transferase subunit ALG13